MSYQYAASYSSTRDAEGQPSYTSWILGSLMNLMHVKGRPRASVATIVRRRLLSVPTALILLWIWVLHWGERTTFNNDIAACDWATWEQWVCFGSSPGSGSGWSHTGPLIVNCTASTSAASPRSLGRRPPARRSPHISWTTMASVLLDCGRY